MAVALILDFPGGTREQYDQVVEGMQLGGRMAAGGLFHAAGATDGGWRVVDVWESLATFERFRDAQIMPQTQAAGMEPPAVRVIEVRNERPASGAAPRFLQIVTLPGPDEAGFRELDSRVLPDNRVPDAMTFHVNGPTEGGWVVIDAWESKEARDRFLEEHAIPVIGDSPKLTDRPVIEDLAVERTLAGRTAATA